VLPRRLKPNANAIEVNFIVSLVIAGKYYVRP